MDVRYRYLLLAIFCFCLTGLVAAQNAPPPVEQLPTDKSAPPPKDNTANPPRSDNVPAGESSSKQTEIDISPPANDAKTHPEAGLGDSAPAGIYLVGGSSRIPLVFALMQEEFGVDPTPLNDP